MPLGQPLNERLVLGVRPFRCARRRRGPWQSVRDDRRARSLPLPFPLCHHEPDDLLVHRARCLGECLVHTEFEALHTYEHRAIAREHQLANVPEPDRLEREEQAIGRTPGVGEFLRLLGCGVDRREGIRRLRESEPQLEVVGRPHTKAHRAKTRSSRGVKSWASLLHTQARRRSSVGVTSIS